VGGNVTTVNEFPWLAGIAYSSDEIIFCGGTLIASKWVVTASHCLYADIPVSASDLRVILGEYDLSTVNEEYLPRRVLRVSLILLHYYYDSVTMQNDIALIKLAEVVDMNIYTPVCLPAPDLDISGKTAWVYGEYFHGDTIHS
jgi:secreted trypsin-like serine protease